jgi:4-hydroxyphenylacetaldehyde oxime monooxygenase
MALPVLECTPAMIFFVFLLPFLALLALATRSLFYSNTRKGRLHLPPGPLRLPVLGNLHQIMGALPHRSLRELARRHGPVMQLWLGTVPTVAVSSAEAAREVLKTHDAACCSRPDTPGARRLSYGHKDVAFVPYSDYWREMRKLFIVELLSMRRVQAAWYAREAQVIVPLVLISRSVYIHHLSNILYLLGRWTNSLVD